MQANMGNPESREKWSQKEEELYGRIEIKIELMRQLWAGASELPIPSPDDSPETIQEDKDRLYQLLNAVFEAFPQTEQGLRRLDEIQEEMQKIPLEPEPLSHPKEKDTPEEWEKFYEEFEKWEQEYGKRIKQLIAEIEKLFSDEDIEFAYNFRRGIENALQRRAEIRKLLEGTPTQRKKRIKRNLSKQRKQYGGIEILGIIPWRFSIAIYASEKSLKQSPSSEFQGWHLSGTPFSIIKTVDSVSELRLVLSLLPDLNLQEIPDKTIPYNITVKHEDFHSFIEGFRRQPGGSANRQCEIIRQILANIRELKSKACPQSMIQYELGRLRDRIYSFQDKVQGELLADLASVHHKSGPLYSLNYHLMQFADFLEKEVKGIDPEIDAVLDELRPFLDHENLVNRIKAIYEDVEENLPERIQDVDMAFTLFPLSKIGRIEALVERWKQKQIRSA